MTVTSNNPSQINQALMDLQRHKGGASVGREQVIEDVYHPEFDEEIRFFMNDGDSEFQSYILLGDLILLFGRYTLTKTGGSWKGFSTGLGTYYQYIKTLNLIIPYAIEPTGALIVPETVSRTESGRTYFSYPAYYYSNGYGLVPGHGYQSVIIPSQSQLQFNSSSLYDSNDLSGVSFTEVINYIIFTRIIL